MAISRRKRTKTSLESRVDSLTNPARNENRWCIPQSAAVHFYLRDGVVIDKQSTYLTKISPSPPPPRVVAPPGAGGLHQ